MVTAEPGDGSTTAEATDSGTAFGKLKQTLSSSLLTSQGMNLFSRFFVVMV